jgi:regulator of RNase E activity RraA
MPNLTLDNRERLKRVSIATISSCLYRQGLKRVTPHGIVPVTPTQPRMVGEAFTIRFVPMREDVGGPDSYGSQGNVHQRAFEECPEGFVLVMDTRGETRGCCGGDLLIGRLKARGCAGIVTDGGFRDTNGVFRTGLPAYHRRASSPPSPIAHRPVDLQLPIACGGIAVYPGDIVVGDRDAVLVIPPDIVEQVAEEALKNYEYEEWAETEVAKGRSLKGLFPVAGDQAKADYEAWKKAGGKR